MDPITYTIALGAAGAGGAAESYWMTIIYDGSNTDKSNSITIDSAQNVYITGEINQNSGTTMPNYWGSSHQKFDKDGNYQFSRVFKAQYSSVGGRIQYNAVDSNDNVYIVGDQPYQVVPPNYTQQIIGGGFIAKYNSAGADQWDKKFGSTTDNFQFSAVKVDSNDNIIVLGRARGGGIGSGYYYWLVKFTTSGTVSAQKAIYDSSAMASEGNALDLDSSDNIYVSGFSNAAAVTVKLNSSFAIQWSRAYELSGSEPMGRQIAVDTSGNVYVRIRSSTNFRVIKYNSSGTLQWERAISFDINGLEGGIATDSSDNVYITGNIEVSGYARAHIIKFNSSGTVQWKNVLRSGPNKFVKAKNIHISGDSLYITGEIASNNYALKVPTDGSLTGTHSTSDHGTVVYETSSVSVTTPSAVTDSSRSPSVANTSWTLSNSDMTEYSFTRANEENITLS